MRHATTLGALVAVLLLAPVWAANTTNVQPQINATFAENVLYVGSTLRMGAASYSVTPGGSGSPVLTFLPTFGLDNGAYTFLLNASDIRGNTGSYPFLFNVSAPGQRIFLVLPPFGGTTDPAQDFMVGTQYPSDCRYSTTLNFFTPNAWLTMTPMQGLNFRYNHSISDLYGTLGITPVPGLDTTILVACDDYRNITAQFFTVTFMDTPPTITVSNDPNPITDLANPITTVTVTGDQDVWCTLDGNQTFGPRTANNFLPVQTATYMHTNISSPAADITITVACENRAGMGVSEQRVINTQYNASTAVTITSPSFTSNRNYALKFTTNMNAQCTVKRGSTTVPVTPAAPATGTSFSAASISLSEGVNTFTVSCVNAFSTANASLDVTVDSVPPIFSGINANGISCSLNGLYFSFNATDPSPGTPLHYNYTIYTKGNNTVVRPWTTTTNPQVSVPNLRLINGTDYVVDATAIDGANNTDDAPLPVVIRASGPYSAACDKEPPSTAITRTYNNTSKTTTVRVVCQDDSGCTDLYYWHTIPSSSNQSCSVSRTGAGFKLNQTQTISQKSSVCWIVTDVWNNQANGTAVVDIPTNSSIPPTENCTDGSKNNYETATDCGGPVCGGIENKKCDTNQTCSVNSDCKGGFCPTGVLKCGTATCMDGVKNGAESGIDCGGTCGACAANQTAPCTTNSDCSATETCKQRVCVKSTDLIPPDRQRPDSTNGDNPPGSDSGMSLLNIILIVLGTLCIIGGGSYIVVYEPPKPPEEPITSMPSFGEEPLALQPEQPPAGDTRANARRRLRERRKERVEKAIGDFDKALGEQDALTHQDIEDAYHAMDKEAFAATAQKLIDDEKITKQDVAVALADAASRDDADHEAIKDLRGMLELEQKSATATTTAEEGEASVPTEAPASIDDAVRETGAALKDLQATVAAHIEEKPKAAKPRAKAKRTTKKK